MVVGEKMGGGQDFYVKSKNDRLSSSWLWECTFALWKTVWHDFLKRDLHLDSCSGSAVRHVPSHSKNEITAALATNSNPKATSRKGNR